MATQQAIDQLIEGTAVMLNVRRLSPQERRSAARAWVAVLGDAADDEVRRAWTAWLRTSHDGWMPRPAEIIDLIQAERRRASLNQWRRALPADHLDPEEVARRAQDVMTSIRRIGR